MTIWHGSHPLSSSSQFQRQRDEGGGQFGAARLDQAEKCVSALHLGWLASPLFDPRFAEKSAYWARLAAEYLRAMMRAPDSAARFRAIPASLVKAMCDVWIRCAHYSRHTGGAEVLPGLMVADASVFCVELMGRPDLADSPVVQDQLLSVIDAFIGTADTHRGGAPHDGGGGGRNSHGSPVYFGSGRGYAGAVMDNQRIREGLAPALMRLYAACHAVAGLDVDADTSYDKFSLRVRANALLVHLFHHPLREPRLSILAVVAEGRPFDAFAIACFDTIKYSFDDALGKVAHGFAEEQVRRTRQYKKNLNTRSDG